MQSAHRYEILAMKASENVGAVYKSKEAAATSPVLRRREHKRSTKQEARRVGVVTGNERDLLGSRVRGGGWSHADVVLRALRSHRAITASLTRSLAPRHTIPTYPVDATAQRRRILSFHPTGIFSSPGIDTLQGRAHSDYYLFNFLLTLFYTVGCFTTCIQVHIPIPIPSVHRKVLCCRVFTIFFT